ncbi:MAG TPA: hypothetical protein DFR83_21440 [Deltaproteobacteria bacterium]|nr:hypothetical protein [Deltaproteobacteria bacterium]
MSALRDACKGAEPLHSLLVFYLDREGLFGMADPIPRRDSPPYRLSLRAILAYFVALAVVATAVAVGTVAFIHSRSTVKRLSTEVFEMEAEYTNARVLEYSSGARHMLALNTELLRDGIVDQDSLEALGNHFIHVVRANPRLSSSGFGHPNGEAMWVSSDTSGQLQVHAYRRDAEGSMMRQSYRVQGSSEWTLETEEPSDYDGRVRPWFLSARSAPDHEPVWTEPYLFFPDNVPGMSLVQEVQNADGEFVGITFVDFELRFLSRALLDFQNDRPGAQSVVFDDAGTVLAHTRPNSTSQPNAQGDMQMVTLDTHVEPLVRRLSSELGLPASARRIHASGPRDITINAVRYVVVVLPSNLLRERTRLDWNVAVIVPEAVIVEGVRRQGLYSVGIGVVIFLGFLVTTVGIARRMTNSFYGFFDEMQRLAALDLQEPSRQDTRILEVHSLGRNLDQMRNGLRSFGRYVSSALVRELVRNGIEAQPGGQDQELTVLFTDVVGFTTISEGLQPQRLAEKLSHNLEETSRIVHRHKGTVDKYIGDSVMAFWNAPNPVADHAIQACTATLEILARIDESAASESPLWPIRIGINTTVALVGNLGSSSRLDYTAIGDGVNLASRIEGINKVYGTRALIGETTKRAVDDVILTRPIDHVVVKGQSRPEPIHELVALRSQATPQQRALAEQTTRALEHYRAARWEQARNAYIRCLKIAPKDLPAALFITRCEERLRDNHEASPQDSTEDPVADR